MQKFTSVCNFLIYFIMVAMNLMKFFGRRIRRKSAKTKVYDVPLNATSLNRENCYYLFLTQHLDDG